MRWTQDGCGEGEDGPSYECVYTDFFLYTKHLSVSLEISLKDFRGQWSP